LHRGRFETRKFHLRLLWRYKCLDILYLYVCCLLNFLVGPRWRYHLLSYSKGKRHCWCSANKQIKQEDWHGRLIVLSRPTEKLGRLVILRSDFAVDSLRTVQSHDVPHDRHCCLKQKQSECCALLVLSVDTDLAFYVHGALHNKYLKV